MIRPVEYHPVKKINVEADSTQEFKGSREIHRHEMTSNRLCDSRAKNEYATCAQNPATWLHHFPLQFSFSHLIS